MAPNLQLLTQVCDELGIPFSFFDSEQYCLVLHFPSKKQFIMNNALGLVSDAEAILALDKGYQAQLLAKTGIIPETKTYIDPQNEFCTQELRSIELIAQDIPKNFSLPVVVKKNSGKQSIHVFIAQTPEKVEKSLRLIFNPRSKHYDHVAVIQPYIEPVAEYRALIFQGKLQFAYTKTPHTTNLSQRWKTGKAELVENPEVLAKIQELIDTLFATWPIPYAGLDIIVDTKGRYWLIEVNTSPGFRNFLRDNDPEPLKELYRKILIHLKEAKGI